jgi:hypothetical protein
VPRERRPSMWLDKRAIKDSDQFDQVITDALDRSEVMLVVLTPIWVSREYCQKELAYFTRKTGSADAAKKRIVIAAKQHMDPDTERPELLRGQNAYRFYDDDLDFPGQSQVFFKRGAIVDRCREKFLDKVEELSKDLVERIGRFGKDQPDETVRAAARGSKQSAGPTIYVAKPAGDMSTKYDQLVKELEKNEYVVVPPADLHVSPFDATEARDTIERYLGEARLSIHLLGKSKGYAPPESPPIVELQMSCARARAEQTASEKGEFRRIIWAPKEMRDADQTLEDVVSGFGGTVATDKLVEDERAAFLDFIIQHLHAAFPAPGFGQPSKLAPKSRVYVDFQEDDWEYALAVGNALKQREINPVAPTFQGDPQQARLLNAKALAEADAVILCWSKAVETWVRTEYASWGDWRELGRNKEFACRGIVAGPPPGREKKMLTSWKPDENVDVILDLTQQELPIPAGVLDPIVEAATHRAADGAGG